MSRFIERVQEQLTGRRVADRSELSAWIKSSPVEPLAYTDLTEYKIGVEWKVLTHCKPDAVPHMLRNVIAQLREELYGQFRQRALEIERAAYERDFDKMHMHIRDLLREIHGEVV